MITVFHLISDKIFTLINWFFSISNSSLDKTLSTDAQLNLKKTHKINIQYTALDITPTYQAIVYNLILNMPMAKEKQVNYFNNLTFSEFWHIYLLYI